MGVDRGGGAAGRAPWVQYLTAPWQRALGAMFRRSLQDSALVFVYPQSAARLFHTFLCPPLRLVALGEAGEILCDQVVPPGRFVRLPATRLVVETDPGLELSPEDLRRLARQAAVVEPAAGAWQVNTSLDRLLFALLRDAVADLRRVHEAHDRNGKVSSAVLRERFPPWERGQLAGSAGFILDFAAFSEIPETAVHLSRQVLKAEARWLDEIAAAALAGLPWQVDFPAACLRCGAPASWRPVLAPPPGLELEAAWRYERPENHVLLCRRCAHWLGWPQNKGLRMVLVQGLWGRRFDAFQAWHRAAAAGRLPPVWDRHADPLWPPQYGGATWPRGSGAAEHAEPRPPKGVARTADHRAALRQALNGRGGIRRERGRRPFAPWQPFLRLAGIAPDELT